VAHAVCTTIYIVKKGKTLQTVHIKVRSVKKMYTSFTINSVKRCKIARFLIELVMVKGLLSTPLQDYPLPIIKSL